jgi:hypothetical protein
VIGRLPGERSCLSLVWAVLDRASHGWRGLTMTSKGLRLLQDLRRQLLHPPIPEGVVDQAVTTAAYHHHGDPAPQAVYTAPGTPPGVFCCSHGCLTEVGPRKCPH